MRQARPAGTMVARTAVALILASALAHGQAPAAPPSTSAARAKELVGLLQGRKLEAIAAREPGQAGRFVAALLVPNAQLLLVAAKYAQPMDIEYYLYQKEFMNAYVNLNSSSHSSEKVFVEDALHDGLIALPGKSLAHDSVTTPAGRQIFDGGFADPRRRNDKKISQEDYMKTFVSADERYATLLTALIEQLKKAGSGN